MTTDDDITSGFQTHIFLSLLTFLNESESIEKYF